MRQNTRGYRTFNILGFGDVRFYEGRPSSSIQSLNLIDGRLAFDAVVKVIGFPSRLVRSAPWKLI